MFDNSGQDKKYIKKNKSNKFIFNYDFCLITLLRVNNLYASVIVNNFDSFFFYF